MKKLIVIFSSIFLLSTQSIFPQWTLKTNGLPDDWGIGLSIDADDENTVVISIRNEYPSNRKIFKSTDKGESWIELIWPFNDYLEEASDICIIDSNNIWFVTSQGRLYKTTDGGLSWELNYYDPLKTTYLNYIEMFDLNNGIAMGDAINYDTDPAVFLKTVNGGISWISTNNTPFGGWSRATWLNIDFVTSDIGYFCAFGIEPYKLYKTTDAGYSWSPTTAEHNCFNVKFYNEMIGLITYYGPPGQLYLKRTTDSGNTWETIEPLFDGWPYDFEFLPSNYDCIWAITHKSAYYSSDFGTTWVRQNISDNDLNARDIVFIDNNKGWILCDDGRVYYTENNGGIVTDVDDDVLDVPVEFQLMQNYPNPFNPETIISFQIPIHKALSEAETPVLLKVYDILGNEVTTLVDEYKSPGKYEVTFNGSKLSSGIYFYTLQAGNFSETKKLVLMK